MNAIELSVCIKTEGKKLTKKFDIFDEFQLDVNDPIIQKHLEETRNEFGDRDKKKNTTITAKLEL